jgi:hypothetical protein
MHKGTVSGVSSVAFLSCALSLSLLLRLARVDQYAGDRNRVGYNGSDAGVSALYLAGFNPRHLHSRYETGHNGNGST